MSFIALKYHFLAQQSISDNKNRGKIFSDKIFFMEIFLKLFNNCDQLKKDLVGLALQSFYYQNAY